MKTKATKSAAILTIKDANRMTKKGRLEVAAWLKRQAAFLASHGQEYSPRFTARYLYR